jgi:hypothetical protein
MNFWKEEEERIMSYIKQKLSIGWNREQIIKGYEDKMILEDLCSCDEVSFCFNCAKQCSAMDRMYEIIDMDYFKMAIYDSQRPYLDYED